MYNNGLEGDLGNVQFPASLQQLDLYLCKNITGDVAAVKWPQGQKALVLGETSVSEDLGAAKWPEGLQCLRLYKTSVSGDLGKVQFPASRSTCSCAQASREMLVPPSGRKASRGST